MNKEIEKLKKLVREYQDVIERDAKAGELEKLDHYMQVLETRLAQIGAQDFLKAGTKVGLQLWYGMHEPKIFNPGYKR